MVRAYKNFHWSNGIETQSKLHCPHRSHFGFVDILVSTPNRLVFLLKQDPPAIDLSW